jgi:predicted RNA binding protein YcfA (HicA-like mRNA interferase family)
VPNPFPSLDKRRLLRVLRNLGYEETRCKGSHIRLVAAGRPPLTIAFHDGASIAPGVVRDILVKQVGLDLDEALKVVQGDD